MKAWRAILPLLLLLTTSCVPWTVVPLARQEEKFNAASYVDSVWSSKVLPALSAAADINEALVRPAPACLLVKGKGKVLRVDSSSRSRLLLIDLPPYDGRPDVAIQIGPVIRGTALRDALPFIQFSQFVNQLEFARVGNELNARVEKVVLPLLAGTAAPGAMASFAGAFARPVAGGLPEIVPVQLAVERGST